MVQPSNSAAAAQGHNQNNTSLNAGGSNHNHANNNKHKPNALQKINPMMWKQARTVKKAVGMVDGMVKDMTTGAPFLESTEPRQQGVAVFQRSEIQCGKLLGEGSYSQVYEILALNLQDLTGLSKEQVMARHQLQHDLQEDFGQKQAPRYSLKLLKRDLLRKPYDFGKAIADLVVEAQYLTRLDHPNIMRVHGMTLGELEAFESGRFDSYFLVMDRLVDSLDQRIAAWQREGMPDPARIPRKTNYALQMANALLYLHKRRIIFRDLKPENVGFHTQHVVQLFDFGLVRELPQGVDNEVYAMSGSGSQWYMASEIFLTGKYNLKADVYSWAMTVYEMLTETKPFAKMHNLQHVRDVCVQGKRPRLSKHGFPKPLETIIRAAWSQSVTMRPTIQQVVARLEILLPELGDEEACVWPTVEQTSDTADFGGNGSANNLAVSDNDDEDGDDLDLEDFLRHTDGAIDEEIKKEVKQPPPPKEKLTTYGDVEDDMDYSMSSIFYGDH